MPPAQESSYRVKVRRRQAQDAEVVLTLHGIDVRRDADQTLVVSEAVDHLLPEGSKVISCERGDQ